MASTKITDLGSLLAAGVAKADVIAIVDISDTTMAASGTTKKISISDLEDYLNDGNINNIYTADGTIGAGRVATLTDTINFTGGNVGFGITPLETAHVNGGFRVDGNSNNQIYVSDSSNFVGFGTQTQLAGENQRFIGDMRISNCIAFGSAGIGANRLVGPSGFRVKFNNSEIRDVSNVLRFESADNDFHFQNSTSQHSMLRIERGELLAQSKRATAVETQQNQFLDLQNSYWNGATYVFNSTKITSTARDTSGGVSLDIDLKGTVSAQFDDDATAGNTRFLIYDVDNATLERVSVGSADSGGAGFKVLRIPN